MNHHRTAVLIGETHDGKEELLASRMDPLPEVHELFWKEFRPLRSHPKYRLVTYQESDGGTLFVDLKTPEQQAADDKLAKDNADRAARAIETKAKTRTQIEDERIVANQKKIAAETERINAERAKQGITPKASKPQPVNA